MYHLPSAKIYPDTASSTVKSGIPSELAPLSSRHFVVFKSVAFKDPDITSDFCSSRDG
jgi:hypothetical protein